MIRSTTDMTASISGDSKETPPKQRIAIVVGSTRTPSVGPTMVSFVSKILHARLPSHLVLETLTLPDLPIFAEPIIPSQLDRSNPTPGYTLAASRAWSETVWSYDGFIFVTPQYNWGIPAGLKNALDYLFHEWVRKPAMVVSYGGHGGGKAAAALKTVLHGLRMKVEEKTVPITLGESQITAGLKGELRDG
jgi:NAD(P)H-dependent FMN reductase